MDINQFHPLHPQPNEPKTGPPDAKDGVDKERIVRLSDSLVLINQRLESIDRKLTAPNIAAQIILVSIVLGFIIVVVGFVLGLQIIDGLRSS